jgi:hypothetical protein
MKLKSRNTTFLIVLLLLLLAACSPLQTQAVIPTEESHQPTEIKPTEIEVDESVTIHFYDAFQFELVDSQGARVLIDFEYPDKMTTPASESDILLTTNTKYHTFSEEFVDTFPGKQLFSQEGQIRTDRVSVTGIASGYNRYETVPEDSTNFIYLIEMDEMRIAILGQIGQEEFTPDQLDALGEIDIVLTQFVNHFSMIDTNNQIGFILMDQMKPKLIIPTFGNSNQDVIELATERWDVLAATTESVTISTSMLTNETQFLIMGSNAENIQALFELPDWEG